jgi:hypothetical protein
MTGIYKMFVDISSKHNVLILGGEESQKEAIKTTFFNSEIFTDHTDGLNYDIIIDYNVLPNLKRLNNIRDYYKYLTNGGYYFVHNISELYKKHPNLVRCAFGHDTFLTIQDIHIIKK